MEIRALFGLLFFSAVLMSGLAKAQSPIGKWIAYDEKESPRSVVEIYQEGDTLSAKIVKQLLPRKGKTLESNCTQCDGELKDKPKEGMVIVTGLKKDGDKWVDGKILDTDSGSSYNCKISLSEDKQQLNVRVTAFLGLGATVYWKKASQEL